MSLVVIGTGTGVGKTVTCALLLWRYGKHLPLAYWKPVATGPRQTSDVTNLRRWCHTVGEIFDEGYRLSAPLSPHEAARREHASIRPRRLVEMMRRYRKLEPDRHLIVEGIGGLLVPLTVQGYLLADLLEEFHLPCLVVAQNILGTINHTLLTLEALRARKLELAGVILQGPPNPMHRRAIERFGKAEVVAEIGPLRSINPASLERAARSLDRSGALARYLAP